MMPLPEHLREYTTFVKAKSNTIILSLQCCKCTTTSFVLYKNSPSKEEKKLLKPWRDAMRNWYPSPQNGFPGRMTQDENGVWHYWKILSADGEQREEIFIPKQPPFATVEIVKAVCSECGQEITLFDSRIHGYGGITAKHSTDEMEYIPQFKQINSIPQKIQIEIENDNSLDDFVRNSGMELSEQEYSNAYSWIKICGIDSSGKRKKIFECETA